MKKLIIGFLFMACAAFAQPNKKLPPPFDKATSAYIQQAMRDSLRLFPDTTGHSNQFLGGNLTWQSVQAGLENWIATDGPAPVLAPTVTAGTKGFAMGDSAVSSGFESMSLGNDSRATGIGGLTISVGGRSGFPNSNSGLFSTLIANSGNCIVASSGTVAIGYGVYDACTINTFGNDSHGNVNGGYNVIIGPFASTGDVKSNFNTILGYSATVNQGRSNLVAGDGAYANGSSNIELGSQTGTNDGGVAKYRINIYSQDTTSNLNGSSFDSTTIIGGRSLVANNNGEYLFGAGNESGSNFLMQVSDGGRHGNLSTYDALSVLFDGTVKVGKKLVVAGTTWPRPKQFFTFSTGSRANINGHWFCPTLMNGGGETGGDPTDSSNKTNPEVPFIVPVGGGTIKNFTVTTVWGVESTDSMIITFVKNTSLQPLTITIKGGQYRATDSTNSFAVSYGDLVAAFANAKTTATSFNGFTATWEFDPNFFIHYYTGYREQNHSRRFHETYTELY